MTTLERGRTYTLQEIAEIERTSIRESIIKGERPTLFFESNKENKIVLPTVVIKQRDERVSYTKPKPIPTQILKTTKTEEEKKESAFDMLSKFTATSSTAKETTILPVIASSPVAAPKAASYPTAPNKSNPIEAGGAGGAGGAASASKKITVEHTSFNGNEIGMSFTKEIAIPEGSNVYIINKDTAVYYLSLIHI